MQLFSLLFYSQQWLRRIKVCLGLTCGLNLGVFVLDMALHSVTAYEDDRGLSVVGPVSTPTPPPDGPTPGEL